MILSLILFAISAAGGAVLALLRIKSTELPPMALALVHGGVGAAALVSLLVQVIGGTAPDIARIALVVLFVAAIGGFVLFSFHLRKKPLPIGLVCGHGLIAVVGFVLLLKGVLG